MSFQSNNPRMRAAHCFRNFSATFNEWPVSPADKTEARTLDELDKTNDLRSTGEIMFPLLFLFDSKNNRVECKFIKQRMVTKSLSVD